MNQAQKKSAGAGQPGGFASEKVVHLRPPARWHDPLNLIQTSAPNKSGRIVLWTISLLILFLLAWASFGQLDVIASA